MIHTLESALAGKDVPTCIAPTSTVREALKLMTELRVGQLPVVDAQGKLIGIVSQQNILSTYYHIAGSVNMLDLTVSHCQDEAVSLDIQDDLYAAAHTLRGPGAYAVIITKDGKPAGILTGKDMSRYFNDLFEGLMMIEEVELVVRPNDKR
jgi:CBS domain-containing protein